MNKQIAKIFGTRVDMLIDENGIDCKVFSDETGIVYGKVIAIVTGRVKELPLELVCNIADYFGCSIDYLLGRSEVYSRI